MLAIKSGFRSRKVTTWFSQRFTDKTVRWPFVRKGTEYKLRSGIPDRRVPDRNTGAAQSVDAAEPRKG